MISTSLHDGMKGQALPLKFCLYIRPMGFHPVTLPP